MREKSRQLCRHSQLRMTPGQPPGRSAAAHLQQDAGPLVGAQVLGLAAQEGRWGGKQQLVMMCSM